MRKERQHYTADEKAAVLRRHLLDKVPVSDLCEELSLKPTVFFTHPKSHLTTLPIEILTVPKHGRRSRSDGEGIEDQARRGALLVRAEVQHLGIRRCVSDPPSNRGKLTVWESHDLAQIQQILICGD
jgi:transposase-like protein